jgi:hypothetical protein
MGLSAIGELANIIEGAMNPTCASNVMSLVCHSFFKECRQVEATGSGGRAGRLRPSLLCQSECEKHLETWNACLGALDFDNNPVAKKTFHDQMIAAVWYTRLLSNVSNLFSLDSLACR